jgi:4-hydroxy-tetrahydrodipicolinate reductase
MKIALIGYGKMGKEIEKIAIARGHEIVSIIDIDNQQDFESEAFRSADVAIEFTAPTVAYQNYLKAFKAGVKLVSGSTGWMDQHGEEIKRLCTEGGQTLFWSSNFSLGVAIFSAVNKYLAGIMNAFPTYDVKMTETHHIHKLDAPSGTAITLAEGILEKLDRKDKWVMGTLTAPDGTVTGTTDCAANELPVSAIREGEVPGIHSIRYESEADSITITHDAKNRKGFALGAVLAAEYTAQHQGFLGMSDLFQFKEFRVKSLDHESIPKRLDQIRRGDGALPAVPPLAAQLAGTGGTALHLRCLHHAQDTLDLVA